MEEEEDVQRGRLPIKSFAEITSCHTIHISENFPCYRGDDDDNIAAPANEMVTLNGNKGIKRERSKSAVFKGFKQGKYMFYLLVCLVLPTCFTGHGVEYLLDAVPDVDNNFDVISKIGEGGCG